MSYTEIKKLVEQKSTDVFSEHGFEYHKKDKCFSKKVNGMIYEVYYYYLNYQKLKLFMYLMVYNKDFSEVLDKVYSCIPRLEVTYTNLIGHEFEVMYNIIHKLPSESKLKYPTVETSEDVERFILKLKNDLIVSIEEIFSYFDSTEKIIAIYKNPKSICFPFTSERIGFHATLLVNDYLGGLSFKDSVANQLELVKKMSYGNRTRRILSENLNLTLNSNLE